jgi:hypothetical protein
MRITRKLLVRHKACEAQLTLFDQHFPDGIDVTEAGCLAAAQLFQWTWIARRVLQAQAYAEYTRVLAQVGDDYKRATDQACAGYERVRGQAYAEYERATDQAYAEYARRCAAAFGRLAETL